LLGEHIQRTHGSHVLAEARLAEFRIGLAQVIALEACVLVDLSAQQTAAQRAVGQHRHASALSVREHVAFDRVYSSPQPARGTVPIVLGGNSAPAVERAGRIGDGWYPYTIGPEDVDSWIVLANPFTPHLERWLAEWNVAFPDAPSIGGISSGATESGEDTLLLDGKAIDAAVLALAVKGGKIRTIVSQGCKPVGEPFTITQADENLIYALGSRPAYQVLSETFNGLSDDEKERARGNLFAGLAASEYVAELKRGDFLVRNLLGADPQTGAVAIGVPLS
jgi:hypothetical protein